MASFTKAALGARLLSELNSIKTVDVGTGNVSFSGGFAFHSAEILLEDLLALNPAIPGAELRRVSWQALVGAARVGEISANSFLQEADRLEKEYLSRRPRRLVLITQISLSTFDRLPGAFFDGLTISFPQQVGERFGKARAAILKEAGHSLHAPVPKDYRWVRVGVTAKNDSAAADSALEGLHLL